MSLLLPSLESPASLKLPLDHPVVSNYKSPLPRKVGGGGGGKRVKKSMEHIEKNISYGEDCQLKGKKEIIKINVSV